jgi:hypothetical protein
MFDLVAMFLLDSMYHIKNVNKENPVLALGLKNING